MGAPGPGAEKGDDETEFYGLAQLLRYHKNALQFLLLAVKLNSKIFIALLGRSVLCTYIYMCTQIMDCQSTAFYILRRSSSFPA